MVNSKESNPSLFPEKPSASTGPVECLGMTLENDEARREHFLGLLREGLEELYAKLGGVPFTTVEDAVAHLAYPSIPYREHVCIHLTQ